MEEGDQQRRRSARLVALDSCKGKKVDIVLALPARNAPPIDTKKQRGRKKRLLEEAFPGSASSVNDINNLQLENGSSKPVGDPPSKDQPLPAIACPKLPEKRLLELVLDVLQKKDSRGIFAEPVDPEEVLGYYDIIKDPMDLGTMRLKLQEGMYASLEQFEHDVFLITNNAMLFNACNTIYYKQARVLADLAKKVFSSLRSNEVNFEAEFSLKRRNYKRSLVEPGGLNDSSFHNVAMNSKASGSSTLTAHERSSDNLPGSRRTNLYEDDRRSTGRSWASYLSENESMSATIYNASKALVPVNPEGVQYKESLMRFARDLGPTAQKVAERKLQQCQIQPESQNFLLPVPNCQVPATSPQCGPNPLKGLMSFDTSLYGHEKISKQLRSFSVQEMAQQPPMPEVQLGVNHRTVFTGDLNFPPVGSTNSSAGHSIGLTGSSKSCSWTQPTELNSQSKLTSFIPSQEVTDGSSYRIGSVQGKAAQDHIQFKTVGAEGVFNLSFLQSRLCGRNSSNQVGILQPELEHNLVPETETPAFNSIKQSASGYTHEAEPSIVEKPFIPRSIQERAQLNVHQVGVIPTNLSSSTFGIPEPHKTEPRAEELSFPASSSHERPLVPSYPAELGAEGSHLDEFRFNEMCPGPGGRRPPFNAFPSLPMLPHQADSRNDPKGKAPVRSLPTELMSNSKGKAPVRSLLSEMMNSTKGLSWVPENNPQIIPSSGWVDFNTLSLPIGAPVQGHLPGQNLQWGLDFHEMGLPLELNPVGWRERDLSLDVPMSFNALPPDAAMSILQQKLNTGAEPDNQYPNLALRL